MIYFLGSVCVFFESDTVKNDCPVKIWENDEIFKNLITLLDLLFDLKILKINTKRAFLFFTPPNRNLKMNLIKFLWWGLNVVFWWCL